MKNKEFVNLCYKYLNRFINVNEFIAKLKKINTNKTEIENLIDEIQLKIQNISNDEDEFSINKRKKLKKLINGLEQISKNIDNKEFLDEHLKNLKDDYNKKYDSQEVWIIVTECIFKNKLFNSCLDNLTKYEMLEFIVQYIQVPFPPHLTQDEFNELAQVGIENDEREWLWRLAFNYEGKDIDFSLITNYFIKMNDGYYLAELISAVGEYLNIDCILDQIDDKDLINYLIQNKEIISAFIDENQINKLKNKLQSLCNIKKLTIKSENINNQIKKIMKEFYL